MSSIGTSTNDGTPEHELTSTVGGDYGSHEEIDVVDEARQWAEGARRSMEHWALDNPF